MTFISRSEKTAPEQRKLSIQHLRRLLLVVLTLSTIGFTSGVYVLVQRIFQNFGPGVEKDLIWKTVQGSDELAHSADLGLAVKDAKLVTESFAEYYRSDDILGIAAVDADGTLVASAGTLPEPLPKLFSGARGVERRTPGYLVAWAPAAIEGSVVGKVAIVVKTRRLVESRALLRRMSYGTSATGFIVLLLGVLFVNFFTRNIADRDAQLAGYASALERKVASRTVELDRANQGMRLVLDNVDQGFLTVSLDGTMADERSTIVDRWFGPFPSDRRFSTLMASCDAKAAMSFELGCEALRDGFLPLALLLEQMPKGMTVAERTLRISYSAIGEGEMPERLLVVLSDVTEELGRARVERDSREMMRAFQRITADRAGFEQFFGEAAGIVEQILAGAGRDLEKRLIHTLKGNCSVFAIESVAESCHGLETQLEDEQRGATATERAAIGAAWDRVARPLSGLLGHRREVIEVEEGEYQALLGAIRGGLGGTELLTKVEKWRHEPVSLRLARLSDKARYMADKLEKKVRVHIEGGELRLDGAEWTPFWMALVHAVNNALDHGIEPEEARVARGKDAVGNLWLSAAESSGALVISLRDDGRGVDWERVKEKARAARLPHGSHADLVAALFADGLSTRDTASVTSGRGLGMGALRAATVSLGGQIEILSEPNQGTTLRFRFPLRAKGADSGPSSVRSVA